MENETAVEILKSIWTYFVLSMRVISQRCDKIEERIKAIEESEE